MRKLLVSVPVVLLALFAACEQEVYEKGDGELSYLRADFVEAFVNADKKVSRVLTDNDDELTLTTPYTADWIKRPDTTYRAVLYYKKVENRAEALSLARVTTLTLRNDSSAVSKWNPDPIGMETVWVGHNLRYLNLGLVLKTGATDKDAKPQSIGMLHGGITVNEDSTRTLQLLFNHHQGDAPEYYSQRAYVSLPLSGLTVDSVRLTVVTYNGTVVRTFSIQKESDY